LRSAGNVGFPDVLNDLSVIAPALVELQQGKGVFASGDEHGCLDWTTSIKSQNPHQSDLDADKQRIFEAEIHWNSQFFTVVICQSLTLRRQESKRTFRRRLTFVATSTLIIWNQ
jgi:hypothetical protein